MKQCKEKLNTFAILHFGEGKNTKQKGRGRTTKPNKVRTNSYLGEEHAFAFPLGANNKYFQRILVHQGCLLGNFVSVWYASGPFQTKTNSI